MKQELTRKYFWHRCEHSEYASSYYLIGHAEMEKEMQKTVTIIIQSQENIEEERGVGIKKLCGQCNKGS